MTTDELMIALLYGLFCVVFMYSENKKNNE